MHLKVIATKRHYFNLRELYHFYEILTCPFFGIQHDYIYMNDPNRDLFNPLDSAHHGRPVRIEKKTEELVSHVTSVTKEHREEMTLNTVQIMLSTSLFKIISPVSPQRAYSFAHLVHLAEEINIDTGSDDRMFRDGGKVFQM
jgi:hypothetical protein